MKFLNTRRLRFIFGLLGLSAIATEIIVLVNQGVFNPSNFFSFFTIQSNIIAALLLLYLALTNAASYKIQVIRGATALYMLMTGVIFALLLSGLTDVRLTAVPWDNTVLHYIMPIVVVLDWVLNPPKNKLPAKVVWAWVVFPFAYVAYTLVRGSIVSWYPYPFLNPQASSYAEVGAVSVVIAVLVVAAGFVLRSVQLGKKKRT
ncbi:MAG: Pr6Pr family membrane protein [Candidatus Saccharibacteria bacterium]|nr:MAG: Pr6Pr family membrane protein [Candidatus Saccharibacteria bacterium]